jgi:HK97 family phage prohead protease
MKKSKKEFEQRAFEFEVRAEKSERGYIITGRPIVYEQYTDMGWYREIIERGALDGCDMTDVRFLVNHDTKMIPLARSRRNNGNSTMQLSTDYDGLNMDYVALDVEKNATASELYSAVERGDISGMSFMFTIDGDEWENLESNYPTRKIKRIGKVIEVSAVTFPAYEQTTISARSKEVLDNARAALENARKIERSKSSEDDIDLLKLKIKMM